MPSPFQSAFDTNRDRYIREWMELLRFPSISADPTHTADCQACARWLEAHLRQMGFQARLLETAGKPVVYAERPGPPGLPTVLYYGHYDVQPVDPIEAWKTPPFEPEIREGRMFARGASDNKGQFFYGLKAIETLIQTGVPLPTLRLVLEGEEESHCIGLVEALRRWPDLFKADVLMVTDTGAVAPGIPTITMSLRGIIHATVRLTGASHDLHSGVHGGAAPNPIHALAALIARLHRKDGRIAIPALYRNVRPPSPRERKLARAFPLTTRDYQARTGVSPLAGERRFTPVERIGFRPCLDVNGFHSGYGGAGAKTIIPASAMAKITVRLVAGQDPDFCLNALVGFLERNAPKGFKMELDEKGAGANGVRLNVDSAIAVRACKVLDRLTGRKTVFHWSGASVPIVAGMARVAGAEPLLVGFSLDEDTIHAPNESFSLDQFRLGFLYVASMLTALAE